jgi:hypothetical protein
MRINNKIAQAGLLILGISLGITACQKMTRPALGNYPKDTNPPGGPLKFFAALDGGSVDSIRATYATDNNVTYIDGVKGKGLQFDATKKGYVVYPSANDFGTQTNFSAALWFNAGDLSKKDHVNADGVIAFGKSSDFWGNLTIYVDHESSTADSMLLQVVVAGKFQTYSGAGRVPHMYDGKWHQLVVTYDGTSTQYTLYIDGAKFDQKLIAGVAFKDASVLVLGGFEQAASIQGTYDANTWMSPWPGGLDQIRLYGTVLSAADVTALYTSKS